MVNVETVINIVTEVSKVTEGKKVTDVTILTATTIEWGYMNLKVGLQWCLCPQKL